MAQTTRASAHLTQITRLRFSNCYLVAEDDGLTLVDTSLKGSATAILAAAQQLGQPIRRIAITHAHGDHVGSLDALARTLGDGVEVLVGAREAPLMAGDLSLRDDEPGRLRGVVFERCETAPTRLLSAGDAVGSLEVVAAPGHSPGQLAFLDRRDRTLLCADAFYAIGEPFVTTEFVWRFPFLAPLPPWHGPTALETATRLCDLEPARLACGHGRVVEAPVAQMRAAVARARGKRILG